MSPTAYRTLVNEIGSSYPYAEADVFEVLQHFGPHEVCRLVRRLGFPWRTWTRDTSFPESAQRGRGGPHATSGLFLPAGEDVGCDGVGEVAA